MKTVVGFFCALLLVVGFVTTTQATLIDFETFDVDTSLGPVTTADGNTVTFYSGAECWGYAYVAGVGAPETAFAPNDTPAASTAGERFLTDELDGPVDAYKYCMTFDIPVFDLSLDLYDYRVDGGPGYGDTATLNVYDTAHMLVGNDVFTIPTPNPVDGNVAHLAVLNPSALIQYADVIFSTPDVGTGIDNIEFNSAPIPEPATVLLLGTGLVGLAGFRKKFKK